MHYLKYTASCLFFILHAFSSIAGPDNIAPEAKVTASSILDEGYAAENVADGVIGILGQGEWACKGDTTDWGYIRFPWIQLEWEKPRKVNRIVLYDRTSEKDHIAGGKLLFSDGSMIWVQEIPNNGTGKSIAFEPKTISWVKFVTTDGKGKDLGFSEIEVFSAPDENSDFVSWVDPYIETNRGRYFFFIPGQRPFGMIGAAPLTRNKNQNGGGYNYNENEILGFEQIHAWMLSGIEVMPIRANVDPTLGQQGWKSRFSHSEEIVQPGYQRVHLQDHAIWVEFTATERVSFYRYRFTKDMEAAILTNLGGYVGNSTMKNARVRKISDREFEGSFSSVDRYWGGPKEIEVFFVVQFDEPYRGLGGWKGKELFTGIEEILGDSLGAVAQYEVKAGDLLQMKIAISYTSVENARENLQAECTSWDFDKVRSESREIWNDWLSRIKVEGGTDAQKIKFYTDLWHVLLGRHKINDVNGDYPDRTEGRREGNFTDAVFKVKKLPKDKEGNLLYNMYQTDAWWLTQWNLNVLWGLAWPEVMDEMAASMVQYARNGYLLPRGPVGGGYSYIMTSCPATNLIVSAHKKKLLTKVPEDLAYKMVRQNHLPGGMLGAHEDIDFYTENGYWPGNAGITIEAAFQDYALAQMAKSLGKTKDHKFFLERSGGWKNLFHEDQKLLFPKDKNGQFMHTDPLSGAGWVEANAWQGTWGISHGIGELVQLMGGADIFCEKLNHAFEQAKESDFVFAYNEGYVSYANQPACSNAHVFSYAGKPWLTQYWVRRVKEQAYGGITPDLGYGGHDEDQGQMGGMSALMAIGLFNIQGSVSETPIYEITSPVFDKVTIQLDEKYYAGKQFEIITYDNSKDNLYIQKAALNGQALDKFWFTHEEFAKGGILELWLGSEPNKNWGIKDLPPGTNGAKFDQH
ncbi:GH92 family glycosyl hydrolase [Negadavirga shengliensis]|uniref:GH92 family glycosyl hydrolase n=1 Tax=Negadavirga shengliensis TaxID=1389218 RepID=A0ABV9T0I2_9BACT